MSNNKILTYFSLVIIALSFYLTRVAVCWSDDASMGFIDHFVHLHIDLDNLPQLDSLELADESGSSFSRFAQDLREYGQGINSTESGTCSWGHNTD